MGASKRLIVSATGFPATTETWRFIQQAWREPLEALARMAGENVKVTGCYNLGGAVVSPGYICVNGVIYPFQGGTPQEYISKHTTTVSATYDVDMNNDGQQDLLPQYETAIYKFGTEGTNVIPFNSLTRLKTIKELSSFELPDGVVVDPNYTPTAELIEMLSNVQADWNVNNPQSDAYIKNKPTLWKPLRIGSVYLGAFPNAPFEKRWIHLPQGLLTKNYAVVGSLVHVGHSWYNAPSPASVTWCIGTKWFDKFQLIGRKHTNTQNYRFDYMLVKL